MLATIVNETKKILTDAYKVQQKDMKVKNKLLSTNESTHKHFISIIPWWTDILRILQSNLIFEIIYSYFVFYTRKNLYH